MHEKSSNNSGHLLIENIHKQENKLNAKLQERKSRYADKISKRKKSEIEAIDRRCEKIVDEPARKQRNLEENAG